ncbi:MAG: DUF1592 domain-containing protein [Rubripirellula sp.]
MYGLLSRVAKRCAWLTSTACLALVLSPNRLPAQQSPSAFNTQPVSATAEISFKKVALPFLKTHCYRCHNEQERESGIRVDQLDGDLPEASLKLWEEISEQIEISAMPPEEEPQPTAEQRKAMTHWISNALHEARSRTRPVNGSVRRLTVQQYKNALRELLGVEEDFAASLPADGVSRDGFTNDSNTLLTSPLQVEAWFNIAEKAVDACLVDEASLPSIQNFRMDLGKSINAEPFGESLILGANSRLLPNQDFKISELDADKPFAFKPFRMQTKYRFNEGYQGNGTVRGWRDYDSIYHAVFACMRGDGGYPKGSPYRTVKNGLLLRPSIPTTEIFRESSTYGPKANFKIALRELPEDGRFRIRIKAAKYKDGLLLTGRGFEAADTQNDNSSNVRQIVYNTDQQDSTLKIDESGIYQIDVHPKPLEEPIDAAPDNTRLSEGLIGHWSFEGDSPGTSTTGKHVGTLSDGTKTVNSPIGKNGKAISLDGSKAYVVVPRDDSMNVGAGNFTVSAWIKPTQLRQSGIVCLGRYNWTHGWYFDMPNNEGVLRIETVSPENKSNGTVSSRPGVIQVNQWQHVAAVVRREENQTHLYVNGYKVASGTVAATNLDNPSVDLHLGRIQDAQLFKGQIDEVKLYRRALEPAELQALMEPGRPIVKQPPLSGAQQLDLTLDDRVFSSKLKKGESAFLAVRIPAGDHQLIGNAGKDNAKLGRLVLTRLAEDSRLASEFRKFESRNPNLGVYMGLRRDCGHTCLLVQQPQVVANTDLQSYVFEGSINNYPRPFVEKGNDNYLAGVREITVRNEYTDGRDMPRLRLASVEFEGPLYDSWPPASHQRIFIPSENRENRDVYAREIIQEFASRAFRRPITEKELQQLAQTWKTFYEVNEDFQESIRETLVVILTSPSFLFIVEQSDSPQPEDLNPMELASKLSFFLWNGPPDNRLIGLARSGKLKQSLSSEVIRMVQDKRFGNFADQFAAEWLSIDKFDVVETDRKRYPRLTSTVKRQIRQEPARFLQYLFQKNLPAENLIRSDFVVVNEIIANYYGLGDQSESGFEFVPLKHQQPHLGGILSQAAVLAGLSDGKEANPVKRGAWFARKIIAEPPADPPPNVPELKDESGLSLRERLQQHRNVKGCAKCHQGIDPWGLAFEQYDAGGLFSNDRIDATSKLPDGHEVHNLNDLRDHLANNRMDSIVYSVVRHLSVYAMGRSLTYNEDRVLKQQCLELKAKNYGMLDIIQFVVASDLFLKK